MTESQQMMILQQLAKKEQADTEAAAESSRKPAADASKPQAPGLNTDALYGKIRKDIQEYYRRIESLIHSEMDRSFEELREELREIKEEAATLTQVRKGVEVVKWLAYNLIIIATIIILIKGGM